MISWFEKHCRFSWLITFLIASAIFYVSTINFQGAGGGLGIQSILYHFFIFFIFAFFLLVSLIKGDIKKRKLITAGILIAILYGISDEIHQMFVSGRYSSISDILTNSAGILSSGVIYAISVYIRNNNNHKQSIDKRKLFKS